MRLLAAPGFENAISASFQDRHGQAAHAFLIFNDEHRFVALQCIRSFQLRCLRRECSIEAREVNPKRSASAGLALQVNPCFVSPQDAVNSCEAESGPPAALLGGKERFKVADAKSKQPAPVFVDWFTWQSPLFDNRMRAFHCIDICFWFHNTDLMLTHTGGGPRPRALSAEMAGALLQFMKTGDPNGGGLPKWPKYSPANGETMVLDDACEVMNDRTGRPEKRCRN